MASYVKKLAVQFGDQIESHEFFVGWTRENPREFRRHQDTTFRSIDLQLDKWWDKSGGKIRVNMRLSHDWQYGSDTPIDEVYDEFLPLTHQVGNDRWWPIHSDDCIERFSSDLKTLLSDVAIPWFTTVATKEGYYTWLDSTPEHEPTFYQHLELRGIERLRREVAAWLGTLPRQIDNQLEWLVKHDLMNTDLSKRIRLASLQEVSTYKDRIEPLIAETR
jgi:hypothetical protein